MANTQTSLLAPNSNPSTILHKTKDKPETNSDLSSVAEKEGFEPSLHSSHTTPLAGEPLEPLGYFSTHVKLDLVYA